MTREEITTMFKRREAAWRAHDAAALAADHSSDAVVISPIGFVCDHVEVLYDLDLEAREVANGIGLPMARAQAVNDHPLFLDMMADVVLAQGRRYDRARPLELVPVP